MLVCSEEGRRDQTESGSRPDRHMSDDRLEPQVGLFELAVVMAWSLILAICWAGYQLVAQNGRLLLRVEGLERHLGELEGMVPSPNDDGVGSEDAAGAEQTWLG